jgi:multidrug efflux system membrane fusion protein
MRLKMSYLAAGGMALGLVGWLASGQLGAGLEEPRGDASAGLADPERPLVAVRVRTSVAEPVEREVVVNGETAPARSVELRAETDGRVVEVGAARGAPVAAGEVLVRLDLRERAAMVEQAKATLRQRELEFEAASELGKKGFQAETKVAQAAAALEAARASLDHMEIDLEHTSIRAPFAGILETRPVEIGDFIDVGDPVAVVIEQDPFIVVGDVAETQIGRLSVGMPGRAELVTGATVDGRIRYVGSRADPGTRTFRVELEVPNPDRRFIAGASARLRITYDRALAHRVPSSLLALDDEGAIGVKAVDGEGEVQFFEADIVRTGGDWIWLAGMPERFRLITVGQGFVSAGDRVRAVPEEGEANGSAGPLVAEQGA